MRWIRSPGWPLVFSATTRLHWWSPICVSVVSEGRLGRDFFTRDPRVVARALLGQRLIHQTSAGRSAGLIVETEAYLGVRDRAAHTFGGRRTERNASMWLAGGHAYVYQIYGLHHCVNVVAGEAGEPVAVLVRALQPEGELTSMRVRRPAARRTHDLCSGPGKLCAALGIDRHQDGIDFTSDPELFIEKVRHRAPPSHQIAVGPRIGVDYAGDWADKPLRFALRGNPHVSRPWPEQ
ncbi:MAG: DNA-3-methyladenine glycosylase [Acidobacteria bacterium]|nr:DNA-3-methyladenine glycosylase [Acidobacteriota bacterium]